jgi:hypothetical protein
MISTGLAVTPENKNSNKKLRILFTRIGLVAAWLASVAKAPANLAGGV